jgi:hypothetical protein
MQEASAKLTEKMQVLQQQVFQEPTVKQLLNLRRFFQFTTDGIIDRLYIEDTFAILEEYLREGCLHPSHHIHVIDTMNILVDDFNRGITFGPV